MKRIIKIIALFTLCVTLIFTCVCFSASAVNGRTSISCSKSNPTVGDTITVTVNFSADADVNAASGLLKYSANNLEFVSANNANLLSNGQVKLVSSGTSSKNFSFSVNFKVKEGGLADIIATDCIVAGSEESSLTGSSVQLGLLTGNEGVTSNSSSSSDKKKSNNANLKSITVAAGTLTPAFSPDVTEYTVTVPHSATDGILSCKVAQANSRLKFGGNRDLAVGITKRTITVTAEDGTEKVYTVVFNRLDENGQDTTAPVVPDDAIEVMYNGSKYFISNDFADMTLPAGFGIDVMQYGEQEVSCIKGASGSVTALCLADENGEKKFFLYNKDTTLSELNVIEVNGESYIIVESTDVIVPAGYTKAQFDNGELKLEGFAFTDLQLKDYFVVSAIAPNGEKEFYRFDTVQKTLQRYPEFTKAPTVDVVKDELPSSRKITVICLFIFAVELIIAVIVIGIILIIKTTKKKAELTEEDEYELSDSSEAFTLDNGVNGTWIKNNNNEE